MTRHAGARSLLALVLSFALACSALGETIRVGAAISLAEALGDIARQYETATGGKVELVLGSSGQIAAQIRSGAAIDLFISAAKQQVDDLAGAKLVDPASRQAIAFNRLVLIVPADAADAPTSFESLAAESVRRIAIGEPRTVPAGQYTTQVFKAFNLAHAVADKLVLGKNVRHVLSYVERGEVSAGIVYATDARASGDKVRVVATADETMHDPIAYPAAIVCASPKQAAARQFLTYLAGPGARAVLEDKGFLVIDQTTPAPAPNE